MLLLQTASIVKKVKRRLILWDLFQQLWERQAEYFRTAYPGKPVVVTEFGYPTGRDRETATRMGYYAVQAFVEGRGNCIIGTQEGEIVEIPIEEALTMKKHLQMNRYKIMEIMQFGTNYVNET